MPAPPAAFCGVQRLLCLVHLFTICLSLILSLIQSYVPCPKYYSLLGYDMQVDTPADIGSYAAARTTVKLTYTSSSSGYGMGVRLVRRQSVERVKQMVAKPPSLVAAVAGVKQKVCMWACCLIRQSLCCRQD